MTAILESPRWKDLREYKRELGGMDLKKLIGTQTPKWLTDPHVHHILYRTGIGPRQQKLVAEGIQILDRNGIDFTQKQNLVWANDIAGQHNITNLTEVVVSLRNLEANGATTKQFVTELQLLGALAAKR